MEEAKRCARCVKSGATAENEIREDSLWTTVEEEEGRKKKEGAEEEAIPAARRRSDGSASGGVCEVGARPLFLLRRISIALHTIAILRGA